VGRRYEENSYDGVPLAIADDQQSNPERIITLACEISELSIAVAMTQLMTFAQQDNARPIRMIINTYGGAVDEMFALYDMMKLIKCPIYTIGLGKIMSAGVLLLCAGEKGHRMIGSHARVMLHPITSFIRGNVFQAANEATELQRLQTQLEACLQAETNMTKKSIHTLMARGNDTYMTPHEAIKHGIVDSMV